MKLVSPKLEFGHLLIGDLDSRGIGVRIEFAFYYQTCLRCGPSNEVEDDFMTDQRLASPVLADRQLSLPIAGVFQRLPSASLFKRP
jgi:hypothetical protein